ncbi:MAG: cation:proton antiporter subunit C [Pseudomonadota bacterium]
MLEFILARYNYWIAIILMMTGLYIVFSRGNLVKKIIGLNFFQTSVFIYYISIGKVAGGTAPIFTGGHGGGSDHGAIEGASHNGAEALPATTALAEEAHHGAAAVDGVIYSNPLPHVLILTAIVVGVATTAVGLALAVRIREAYGTIEEDELEAADHVAEFGEAAPNSTASQSGAA